MSRVLNCTQCTVWLDLAAQIIGNVSFPEKTRGLAFPEKFVLANDGTHDFRATQGHITASVPTLQSNLAYFHEGKGPHHYMPSAADISNLRQVMAELWSLVTPQYFVGSLYSSFTLTACLMRGEWRAKVAMQ